MIVFVNGLYILDVDTHKLESSTDVIARNIKVRIEINKTGHPFPVICNEWVDVKACETLHWIIE
ncbi:MAG: hypothetical protein ACI9NN_000139 [Bacteroidia bacterium]|jgi:hypothetical protein